MKYFVRWLFRRWDKPSIFGNAVVVAFVLTQVLDGLATYWGVSVMGLDIEANPVVGWVMSTMGVGLGITLVKLVAIGLGMVLYLHRIHNAVAILAVFYVIIAIIPWVYIFLTFSVLFG